MINQKLIGRYIVSDPRVSATAKPTFRGTHI